MEKVLNDVAKLSDAELRQHLIDRGQSVGPILHSLRKLFEKRLAKCILRERGIDPDEEPSNSESASTSDANGNHSGDNRSCDSSGKDHERTSSHSLTSWHAHPKIWVESPGPDDGDSGCQQETKDAVYYSISLPTLVTGCRSDNDLVFKDRSKALKVMKEFKGSRFKVFKNRDAAMRFCQVPAEEICPSPKRPPSEELEPVPPQKSGVTEEKCSYKEPLRAERIVLMKLLEKGEVEEVKRLIWGNPRFVVSNGDTPVILHEAFRYNALHIVSKFNQAAICQLYIDAIEDPAFLKMMYPTDTPETTTSRINFLLDLYLNMPEKGVYDGVLHTASKYGSLATVKILAAHPQTDLNLRNKYNETPADVVCRRARVAPAELKDEILEILSSNVYVPLLRTEDNTEPPFVGKPWSPDIRSKGSSDVSSVGELVTDVIQRDLPFHSPLSRTPKDPKLKVKAYAGPMSPTQADKFYKKWHSCPVASPDYIKRRYHEIKRGDMEKGLERLGRDLAQTLHVPWTEHWDFVDGFINISSPAGLQHLEDYLRGKARKQCQNLDFGVVNNNEDEKMESELVGSQGDQLARTRNKCVCVSSDSFDESLEERLNGGGSFCIKCGRTKESGSGAEIENNSHNSSHDSSSSNSSLGSLVERMGKLKVNDSSEDLSDRAGDVIFSFNSVIGEGRRIDVCDSDSDESDSDEEYFEASGIENPGTDKGPFQSDLFHAVSDETSKSENETGNPSHWSVVGVLRNAFAGLRIFSPKPKAGKAKVECLEPEIGLRNDVILDNVGVDEDVFLDAEDSMVEHEEGFQELCSTPKFDYKGSRRFQEQPDSSFMFPGRLQRIYMDGNQPTKLDLDVMRAVESADVNPALYPYAAKWRETITKFTQNEQSRWPSPAAVRRKSRLHTPQPQTRSVFQTTPRISRSDDQIVSRLQF